MDKQIVEFHKIGDTGFVTIKNALKDEDFKTLTEIFEKEKSKMEFEARFNKNGDTVAYNRFFIKTHHPDSALFSKFVMYLFQNIDVDKATENCRDYSWRRLFCHNPTFAFPPLELQFTEYRAKTTDQFFWHSDHQDMKPRSINWILYLNDDFEGGELRIAEETQLYEEKMLQNHKISHTIKPEKNMMVMMPSYFVHKVEPVTDGNSRKTFNGHVL